MSADGLILQPLAAANEKFNDGQFLEALELYQKCLAEESPDAPAPSFSCHVRSRIALCYLAEGDAAAASDVFRVLFDDSGAIGLEKNGVTQIVQCEVFQGLCASLFSRRELKLCAVTALRAHQLFPNYKEWFGLMLKQCLSEMPDLEQQIQALSSQFFECTDLKSACFALPVMSVAPVLAPPFKTPTAPTAETLLRRTGYALSCNLYKLAEDCLSKAMKVSDSTDRACFRYSSAMIMHYAGDCSAALPLLEGLQKELPNHCEVAYGLAQVLVTLKEYDNAREVITKCLQRESTGQSQFFSWPEPLQPYFPESNATVLLVNMKGLISQNRVTVATCRYEDCLDMHDGTDLPKRREIYEDDSFFYYTIHCDEKCTISFHQDCWKKARDDRGKSSECFTPGNLSVSFSTAYEVET